MKNILVAIDFSDATENILEKAKTFGLSFNAKIWLVHVAAPDPDFIGYEVGPQHVRDQRAETLSNEHKQIQEYSSALNDHGVEAEALLIQGPTSQTLLEESQKLDAEMVIIGSHGHGLLYQAVVGSVCSDVIKKSTVPVMIIPSEKK